MKIVISYPPMVYMSKMAGNIDNQDFQDYEREAAGNLKRETEIVLAYLEPRALRPLAYLSLAPDASSAVAPSAVQLRTMSRIERMPTTSAPSTTMM